MKKMSDRWSQIHKEQLDKVMIKKDDAKTQFYELLKGGDMQRLINEKYKKGLLIKFDDACKFGKSTNGVNKDGWLSMMIQSGVSKEKISP